MSALSDSELMSRAAWLYYVGGLNQEATSARLGVTRARVNKLLQEARSSGLVSITINESDLGMMATEDAIATRFGLEFCRATPALALSVDDRGRGGPLEDFPINAVAVAAARFLREELSAKPDATVGIGWGRTLAKMSRQLAGLSAPKARFVSLMGSLTANSAFNPFEVVHALAQATRGEGYVLPVPFIADSEADRDVLLAQRVVAKPLALARLTDLALISVGELTETSLLRSEGMMTADELESVRAAGAVGDTNGIFFDDAGAPVDHDLNRRTLAVPFEDLKRSRTVILAAGAEKAAATRALLKSGIAKGLIVDGDCATAILEEV